jgi:2-oxoglutarate ferredoxin oxidoreductase subunit alpha
VVIAPSDVEDCFDCTVLAFYIAEKYQMPVIVLSDQFIGHRKESINPDTIGSKNTGFKLTYKRDTPSAEELEDYKRFKYTENGVSPITYPGIKGGQYLGSGIEHGENGWPKQDVKTHQDMTEKRWKKFDHIKHEFRFERFYGPDDAKLGIIAWGSTKGAVKEAVAKANAMGIPVGAIIPQLIFPFLIEPFKEFIRNKERVIIPELSYAGQFRRYLRGFLRFSQYGCKVTPFRKTGGAPFMVADILDKIKEEWEKMEAEK